MIINWSVIVCMGFFVCEDNPNLCLIVTDLKELILCDSVRLPDGLLFVSDNVFVIEQPFLVIQLQCVAPARSMLDQWLSCGKDRV